jgi:hypothetical protein
VHGRRGPEPCACTGAYSPCVCVCEFDRNGESWRAGTHRRVAAVGGEAPADSGGSRESQGALGIAFLVLHGSSCGRVLPSNSRPGGGGASLRWSWEVRRHWLEPEKNGKRWVGWKKQRGRGEVVGASVPITHAVTTGGRCSSNEQWPGKCLGVL